VAWALEACNRTDHRPSQTPGSLTSQLSGNSKASSNHNPPHQGAYALVNPATDWP
jgi:hypothetical protein